MENEINPEEKGPVKPIEGLKIRKKANKFKIIKLFKVVGVLCVVAYGVFWVSKNVTFVAGIPTFKKKEEVQKISVDEIPIPVKAYKTQRIDFTDTLPVLGTVKGYREIELRFASSGYIEYINFRDGERAIEGDIIGSLDQREALLKLEYAKNELERNQVLFGLGAIIEAKLEQNKLEYQSARLEYEKTNLITPYDGHIGSIEKQKGDYVTPNDVLATYVTLSDAYVEFGIIEKDVNKIRIGQVATMSVDSFPQDTFSGEIESISPVVEGRTRTFKVKARVVNENEKLLAGMFGRIGIQIYQKDNALIIPSASFRKKDQEYFVFVIHSEEMEKQKEPVEGAEGAEVATDPKTAAAHDIVIGTIEIRPIQIAYATPSAVEIKAGLDEGEIIVADVQQDLQEKAKVEITEVQENIF